MLVSGDHERFKKSFRSTKDGGHDDGDGDDMDDNPVHLDGRH